MLLRVETGSGAVIADVGFGALGLLRPLPLLPEIEAVVPGAAYRLRHEHGSWVVECASLGGAFTDLYAFTLEPNFPVDIEMANHFVATHDSSPFRREVIAQLTRASGRIRLTGRQFQEADGRTRMLEDDDAVLQVLRRAFGIALPAGTRLPPGDGPTPP
jgi:N-hydroxyarylamine O-acetyltransferase